MTSTEHSWDADPLGRHQEVRGVSVESYLKNSGNIENLGVEDSSGGGEKDKSDAENATPHRAAPEAKSYSSVLGTRIRKSERTNKNALEINIETEKFASELEQVMIKRLFLILGINKCDIEGGQVIPPTRPKKVFVWFKPGVDLYLKNA